jgi:hypothetical protein
MYKLHMYTSGNTVYCLNFDFAKSINSPKFFFNFRNICVSVAVFRHILQNILQYVTKDRDTYTYITEIEKNLGECRRSRNQEKKFAKNEINQCKNLELLISCYLFIVILTHGLFPI